MGSCIPGVTWSPMPVAIGDLCLGWFSLTILLLSGCFPQSVQPRTSLPGSSEHQYQKGTHGNLFPKNPGRMVKIEEEVHTDPVGWPLFCLSPIWTG